MQTSRDDGRGAVSGDLDVDVEDVDDRPAEPDGGAEHDVELAAGNADTNAVVDDAAVVRNRGSRARAGATGERLPHTALPHPHLDHVGRLDTHELDIGAL